MYARRGQFYACAMSRTVEWLWIAGPPFLEAAGDATDEELGRLVLDALEGSRQDVAHPPVADLERVLDPLVELAGVKSYRTFEKGARLVEALEQGGVVTLTPTRNAGRDGFLPLEGSAVTVDSSDDAGAVGSGLRATLELTA